MGSYRIETVQEEGRWIARARGPEGRLFGVPCAGDTPEEASGRLERWLAWQREHEAALQALQRAERAYHRTLAGAAFANPTEGPSPLEMQKESLRALEAARERLDEIRARQPRCS